MKKRAMYFKQIQGGISVKKKNWGGDKVHFEQTILMWQYYMKMKLLCTWHLASIHTCTYIMYIYVYLFWETIIW